MTNINQQGLKRMMNRNSVWGICLIVFGLCAGFISGCSTIRPGFVNPTVSVTSLKPLPYQGAVPKFEIGLRVVNPNAEALNPRGMSYSISLNNYPVVEGAANDLPSIPAYGEKEFNVVVTLGLFEAMQFVTDLLQNSRGQVTYQLQAKLDVGALLPAIRIEKTDTIDAASLKRGPAKN